MESIKNAWAWVTKPFRWVSTKIGGPADSRNLIGYVIDFTAGLIKLPFKFIWGVGVFSKKLFTAPREAGMFLLFQGGRVVNALAALCRIRYYDRFQGKMVNDGHRLFWVIWGLLVAFVFLDLFIAMGWILAAKIIFGSAVVGFLASGLQNMYQSWKEFTFEDWYLQHTTARDRAQAAALRQRQQATADAHEAAADKADLAETYTRDLIEREKAKLAALEADKKLAEQRREAKTKAEEELRLLREETAARQAELAKLNDTTVDAEIVE